MVQLAIALPAGCLIGWLLGHWADGHFHQGWIGIAGIVLEPWRALCRCLPRRSGS